MRLLYKIFQILKSLDQIRDLEYNSQHPPCHVKMKKKWEKIISKLMNKAKK